MRPTSALACGIACSLLVLAMAASASAHGFAGARFFPATLAVDDPFVADELSLPTASFFKNPASGDEPASRETDFAVEFSKILFPHFGLSVGETLIHLETQGDTPHTNWGNLEVGGKYEFFVNAPHETILSVGLNAEIGGTGRAVVGADSFSTFTPAFFFGKGFGDLPDSLAFLKPFAITGTLGVTFPTRASSVTVTDDETSTEPHPNVLQWGLALEYSIPYLQSAVKDLGLPVPFDRLFPIVELSFESPLNRGGGKTTGTINPGLLWAGQSFQLSVEAVIPLNAATGHNVGVIGQLHFYLDDLFPKFFGKPIFGGTP
jgi:hypothetical protein